MQDSALGLLGCGVTSLQQAGAAGNAGKYFKDSYVGHLTTYYLTELLFTACASPCCQEGQMKPGEEGGI